jgi:hypothetical protein
LGGEITGIVVLASPERPSAWLSSSEKFLKGVYQFGASVGDGVRETSLTLFRAP